MTGTVLNGQVKINDVIFKNIQRKFSSNYAEP